MMSDLLEQSEKALNDVWERAQRGIAIHQKASRTVAETKMLANASRERLAEARKLLKELAEKSGQC